MIDNIFEEENQKLDVTIQSIDEHINKHDVWLNKTKAEVGGGDSEVEQRRLKEKLKNNIIISRVL